MIHFQIVLIVLLGMNACGWDVPKRTSGLHRLRSLCRKGYQSNFRQHVPPEEALIGGAIGVNTGIIIGLALNQQSVGLKCRSLDLAPRLLAPSTWFTAVRPRG